MVLQFAQKIVSHWNFCWLAQNLHREKIIHTIMDTAFNLVSLFSQPEVFALASSFGMLENVDLHRSKQHKKLLLQWFALIIVFYILEPIFLLLKTISPTGIQEDKYVFPGANPNQIDICYLQMFVQNEAYKQLGKQINCFLRQGPESPKNT